MTIEAIILCGGDGKRLESITDQKIPKAMVEINGKPIIGWQLDWLAQHGVTKFILALGKHGDIIKSYCNWQTDYDVIYSDETQNKLGTGGALRLAMEHIRGEYCFVLYGDILTNFNLSKMPKSTNTVFITKMRSPYGVIEINKETKFIQNFVEKPILPIHISGGVFLMKPATIMDYLPIVGDMEKIWRKGSNKSFLQHVANHHDSIGYEPQENYYWRAIDNRKEYDLAVLEWKKNSNPLATVPRPKLSIH